MRNIVAATAFALATVSPASAQNSRVTAPARTFTFGEQGDPNRAMLGLSTSPSGRRDTLGLLITAVTAGSPAEKAGLEEGNRLIAINGVNLRLSRDDAGDEDIQGVNQNRLTREMRKVKAGDEVTLEVWGSARSRSVKVKTVSAAELMPPRRATVSVRDDDRVALGLFLSSTGSKRDTVGVFVQRVVEGGPAEKAGITEGDRIASINGIDLRVPREDAGEWSMGSSRIERLEREVRKLKAGESADLTVVSGGRSRAVNVAAVRARDLPGGEGHDNFEGDIRAHIEGSLKGLHSLEGLRGLEGLNRLRDLDPDIRIKIENELNREIPDAMDRIRRTLKERIVTPSKEKTVLPSKVQVRTVNRILL